MTDFDFTLYADWVSKNCHYDQCGIAPNNDSNINHVTLVGEKLEHPRVFRAINTTSKILTDVARGGQANPYDDNSIGESVIKILNTDRFEVGEDILIEDTDGFEVFNVISIQKNESLTIGGLLTNAYEMVKMYTVSSVKEFPLEIPDAGSFVVGDYVRLGSDDNYLLRKILAVTVVPDEKVTVECARIRKTFSKNDLISVVFPINGIAPDIDAAIVIPERTYPFNPQQFGVKFGSLNDVILKDAENNEINRNGMAIESQAALEYGSVNILLTGNDEEYAKFAQDLDFNNPMILPGLNIDEIDYSSDADMQLIWKGTTTTRDSNTLKWTYSSNSIHALFPLPLDFKTRSSGDNEFSFKIKGTGGNTGSLNVILHGADGSTFTTLYTGDLTAAGFSTFTIDIDLFAAKLFMKKIEFEITGGSGILYLDDITPFKVPNFDDLMGNPTGITNSIVGTMAVYYDVREAPIHPLTANASAFDTDTIQLTIADSSDFVVGDKIVLYDLDHFEFAEVDSVDDGTHITVIPVYGTFYYDYTIASFASVQLLTFKTRKIAGAYSIGSNLQIWTKTAILLDGTAATWDRGSVSEPSVYFNPTIDPDTKYVNPEIYMSYTGRFDAAYGIGFARSLNFIDFVKLPDNPFIETHDNSKIIELNGFQGLTCRDSSNDIKLFEQETGFLNNLDFHVKLLVRPDNSLGDPDGVMVLYDQGNFRIEIDEHFALSAHAFIDGTWISTSVNQDWNDMQKGWGTRLTGDHWNLIIAQSDGITLSVHKVGVITNIPGDNYFTNSPWIFDSDMAATDTSFDITLRAGAPDPVADQAVYIRSGGTETGFEDEIHWQLNRITAVSEDAPGVWTCDLLYPIGAWGFAKAWLGEDVGPVLAQGVAGASAYSNFTESTADGNGDINFATMEPVAERVLDNGFGSGGEKNLDRSKFSNPKIGSAIDGSQSFTKGLICHCDASNDDLKIIGDPVVPFVPNVYQPSRLGLLNHIIESDGDYKWNEIDTPRWYQYDLTGTGMVPEKTISVAYWEFDDWDGTIIPDSAQSWDMYNNTANPITLNNPGFGTAFSFDDGDNLFTYKYSNLVERLTLLESIIGPSEAEIPLNTFPQLFPEGVALISTLAGAKGYFTEGTITLDLFESAELPDALDIDGLLFNPPNCSVELYFSVTKITDFGDTPYETYDAEGFVTINETIDLTPYASDDLIYYVRLQLKFISDGVDTSEVVEIQTSATGIVPFPSDEFIETWKDTNSKPCLKVNVIDDEGTYYDQTPKLLSIQNITYQIPIFLDDESDILPSGITLTFNNFQGFWNWNNDGGGGNPASPLNGKNYLDFRVQIMSGFESEYISQGVYKIESIRQNLTGSAEVSCSSEFREILDQKIGFEESQLFPGVKTAKEIILEWLIDYGGIPAKNIYFEDSILDYFVSNIEIDNQTIISVLRRLASAANYVVYINAQGEIVIINRTEMNTSGTDYDMSPGEIIADASLTSAMRKNLIKKVRIKGANSVSVVVENGAIEFGRHYSLFNDYIQSSTEALILANQLISDYGLDKQIFDADLKYSPHLKLLDILSFPNPISGMDDSYLITNINRNLTDFNEKITAILI